MIDVGLAINNYMAVARVAYEGTRYAANVAALEEDQKLVYSPADYSGDGYSSNLLEQQKKVIERVRVLLQAQGLPSDSGVKIVTEYGVSGPPAQSEQAQPTHTNGHVVFVKVTVPYQGIGPFFPTLTLGSSSSGPYLYRSRISGS